MKRSILEIYALAVCFGAIICFVITAGIASYDVVRIASPGLTLDQYEYARHQTNDAFFQSRPNFISEGMSTQMIAPAKEVDASYDAGRPSEKVLTEERLASYQLALRSESRSALQSLIRSGIILFISIVLFIFHWRLARRAREANGSAVS